MLYKQSMADVLRVDCKALKQWKEKSEKDPYDIVLGAQSYIDEISDMRDLLSSDKFARAPVPRRLGDARMSPSRGVPRLGHVHPRTRACESDIRALASAFRLSGWGLPPV